MLLQSIVVLLQSIVVCFGVVLSLNFVATRFFLTLSKIVDSIQEEDSQEGEENRGENDEPRSSDSEVHNYLEIAVKW